MAYATNNQISQSPIEGGIEITDAQYREALDGMASGLMVQVSDGVMSLVEPPTERTDYWLPPADKHQTEPGEEPPSDAVLVPPPDDYHVVDGGQWVYSLARERSKMVATMYQAREALAQAGMLDQVETLMADPATDPTIVRMWTWKPIIRRTHPTITDMGTALGLTDEQLDDLFRAAMQIEP